MSSRLSEVAINCKNSYALAQWWKPVVGFTDDPDDPNEPGDEYCVIVDTTTGQHLLFIEVEDLQEAEGRIHLDLTPTDRRREAEVDRVLQLGATQVADRRNPDGSGWVVLADPEGNLFCIVRSDEERVEQAQQP